MKKFLLFAVLVLGLTMSATMGSVTVAKAAGPLDGRAAFSEITPADIDAVLKASLGKTVVLNFFASWCPPCREELPDLIKLRKEVGEDKLVILGVAVGDNLADLKKLAGKFQFNYPVFMGTDAVSTEYGISSIPFNVVFSPEGKVMYADSGIIDCDSVKEFIESQGKEKKAGGK